MSDNPDHLMVMLRGIRYMTTESLLIWNP